MRRAVALLMLGVLLGGSGCVLRPFHHDKKKVGGPDAAVARSQQEAFEEALRKKENGQFQAAAEQLLALDKDAPGQPAIIAHLGDCYYRLGQYERAAGYFKAAMAVAPAYCDLHSYLGQAYVKMGRFDEAQAEYEAEIGCDPAQSDVDWYNLGLTLLRGKRTREALAAFRRSIARRPDFPEPHYQVGLCLYDQGDYPGAVQSLREYLRLAPAGRFAPAARQLLPGVLRLAGMPASTVPAEAPPAAEKAVASPEAALPPAEKAAQAAASLLPGAGKTSSGPAPASGKQPDDPMADAVKMTRYLQQHSGGSISDAVLGKCHAVVIIPGLARGAFMLGVEHGRGLLLRRLAGGRWSNPCFVSVTGIDYGLQVGGELVDLFLVVTDKAGFESLMAHRLMVGEEISITVATKGKYAVIGTDIKFQAQLLAYSRSKGLYAGFATKGCHLKIDGKANRRFYEEYFNRRMLLTDRQILLDSLLPYPAQVRPLVNVLKLDFGGPGESDMPAVPGQPKLEPPKAPEVKMPGS